MTVIIAITHDTLVVFQVLALQDPVEGGPAVLVHRNRSPAITVDISATVILLT